MKKQKKVLVQTRIGVERFARLRAAAERDEISIADYVRRLIQRAFPDQDQARG